MKSQKVASKILTQGKQSYTISSSYDYNTTYSNKLCTLNQSVQSQRKKQQISNDYLSLYNQKKKDLTILESSNQDTLSKTVERLKLQNNQKTEKNFHVQLKIKSKYSKIQLKKQSQIIPIMIEYQTKELINQELRQGLDLIITIDTSQSMAGQKISLLKKTIIYLIDQLRENDRMCIITFNTKCEQICTLKYLTKERKQYLKQLVYDITTEQATNIKSAITKSLDVLIRRKFQNKVTSILFLSDGEDTCDNKLSDVLKVVKNKDKILKQKQMDYQIHSFGYGKDHDEQMLNEITKISNGNFYYIENNEIANQCILECMGILLSIFGNKAKINLFTKSNIKIIKQYGNNWRYDKNKNSSLIELKTISAFQHKKFLCEIEVGSIKDDQSILDIAICCLNYQTDQRQYKQMAKLSLEVVRTNNLGEQNQDVVEEIEKNETLNFLDQYEVQQRKGNKQEAEKKRQQYSQSVKQNQDLNNSFKEKILTLIDRDFISDNKKRLSQMNLLQTQSYNPTCTINFTGSSLQSQNTYDEYSYKWLT